MGPDCGTAVVDGVGLGFANVVAPGPVGIVAASGTGCQQVLALLDHAGVGVATAYGVGGRDLSAEVGGLATRTALARLDADPAVELALLVSKPPGRRGRRRPHGVRRRAGHAGPDRRSSGAGRPDLTAATEDVLRRARPRRTGVAGRRSRRARPRGTRLHGLFVGGTLKEEAAVLVRGGRRRRRAGRLRRRRLHRGPGPPDDRPEPAPGAAGRGRRRPGDGVVLLDVVLGHGAEDDPAASLAPALAGVRPPVVVAVVGTAHDPQDRDRQVAALVAAGAEVHLSNAGATRRALDLLGGGAMTDRVVGVGRRPARRGGGRARPPTSPGSTGGRRCRAPRTTSPPSRSTRCAPTPTRRRWSGCSRSRRVLVDVATRPRGARAGDRASSCTPVRRSPGSAPPDRCAGR